MMVIVNGKEQTVEARTLAELMNRLDYEGQWLATAVNGALVGREVRPVCRLKDGDRIEILSPMQGG